MLAHAEVCHNALVEFTGKEDVLQLSKSGKRAIGRVGRAPSHAATSNTLLMN